MNGSQSLHVIYRLTARENRKSRPDWYSKVTALGSLLQSLEQVPAASPSVQFVVDGDISTTGLDALSAFGSVKRLPGVGNKSSYWESVQFALSSGWSADDLVYFCEDDYLHRPSALPQLIRAAELLDDAEFFSLYEHPNAYPLTNGMRRYDALERIYVVDGCHWRSISSTCMTFGVRLRTLRRVAWLHHQIAFKSLPLIHRTWDYALWRSQQNRIARAMQGLYFPRYPRAAPAGSLAVALIVSRPFHALARMRTLVAPMPSLATHIETDFLALGVDWADVADGAAAWARSHSLPESL